MDTNAELVQISAEVLPKKMRKDIDLKMSLPGMEFLQAGLTIKRINWVTAAMPDHYLS